MKKKGVGIFAPKTLSSSFAAKILTNQTSSPRKTSWRMNSSIQMLRTCWRNVRKCFIQSVGKIARLWNFSSREGSGIFVYYFQFMLHIFFHSLSMYTDASRSPQELSSEYLRSASIQPRTDHSSFEIEKWCKLGIPVTKRFGLVKKTFKRNIGWRLSAVASLRPAPRWRLDIASEGRTFADSDDSAAVEP